VTENIKKILKPSASS